MVVALAVTVIGFILLVVALVTGSVWFAWACIAVCVVGFLLLIVDVLTNRRSGDEDDASPPAVQQAGDDESHGSEPDDAEPAAAEPQAAPQAWSAEAAAAETTQLPRITEQWQAQGSAESIGPADLGRHSATDDEDGPTR